MPAGAEKDALHRTPYLSVKPPYVRLLFTRYRLPAAGRAFQCLCVCVHYCFGVVVCVCLSVCLSVSVLFCDFLSSGERGGAVL